MIGNKLKTLRNIKNLKQIDVANKIGVTRQAICHYENGIREPDLKTLKALALYFDVTTDYLLGLENEDGSKILTTFDN